MESLEKPLEKILKRLGLTKKVAEKKAILGWSQVCGKDLDKHTQALRIKDGILYVAVKSPAWSQQLSFFKPSLIDKINKKQKNKVIKDIYFLVNTIEDKQNDAKEVVGEDEAVYMLTPTEILVVEKMVSNFKGENNLKERYLRLLKKEKLSQKKKEKIGWKKCVNCGVLSPPGEKFCPFCAKERQAEKKGG